MSQYYKGSSSSLAYNITLFTNKFSSSPPPPTPYPPPSKIPKTQKPHSRRPPPLVTTGVRNTPTAAKEVLFSVPKRDRVTTNWNVTLYQLIKGKASCYGLGCLGNRQPVFPIKSQMEHPFSITISRWWWKRWPHLENALWGVQSCPPASI